MIEEDLSKQLGSSPRDTEWDAEPSLEAFVTGFENGGKQRTKGPLVIRRDGRVQYVSVV